MLDAFWGGVVLVPHGPGLEFLPRCYLTSPRVAMGFPAGPPVSRIQKHAELPNLLWREWCVSPARNRCPTLGYSLPVVPAASGIGCGPYTGEVGAENGWKEPAFSWVSGLMP